LEQVIDLLRVLSQRTTLDYCLKNGILAVGWRMTRWQDKLEAFMVTGDARIKIGSVQRKRTANQKGGR